VWHHANWRLQQVGWSRKIEPRRAKLSAETAVQYCEDAILEPPHAALAKSRTIGCGACKLACRCCPLPAQQRSVNSCCFATKYSKRQVAKARGQALKCLLESWARHPTTLGGQDRAPPSSDQRDRLLAHGPTRRGGYVSAPGCVVGLAARHRRALLARMRGPTSTSYVRPRMVCQRRCAVRSV
jgi:hypothetical protein